MFPDDSTCEPLIKITRLYFVRTYHLVERLGIYPGQIPLLTVLYQEDGLSQKELVKRLSVKPSTVAVMIKRMERNGLVQRQRDEDDQRVTRIRLTPAGRKTKEQAAEIMQKLNGAMLEGISSEERLLLRRLLLQIEQNLETAEDCSRGREGEACHAENF